MPIKVFFTKIVNVNAYILSHFNYCPLIWMFCGKEGNKLIQLCHYRDLRALTNDTDKSYEDLLIDCGTVDFHIRNLRLMVTEVYKSIRTFSPTIMQNIFTVKQSRYNLAKLWLYQHVSIIKALLV